MKQKITIVLFAGLLFGLAIINLISPEKIFSENENRYLTRRPKLSYKEIISGEYAKSYEEYAADQFLFRDYWIGLKTLSEMALLKNESSGVYFTKDNTLVETFQFINEVQFKRNLSYLQHFHENVTKNYEIPVYSLLVPTASWLYPDNLPDFAPEVNQQQLLFQAKEILPDFIDVTDQLWQVREDYIYYRTDHHYTSFGAFYCYQAYQIAKGQEPADLANYSVSLLTSDFLGTIHSKAGLYLGEPDEIYKIHPHPAPAYTVDYNFGERQTDTLYELSYLDTKDKYALFLDGNQPFIKITTEQENGKRLLLIKDSFANSFVPFLLDDFQEIYIVDLRYYKASSFQLIADLNISEVLILYSLKGFGEDTNLFFITQ